MTVTRRRHWPSVRLLAGAVILAAAAVATGQTVLALAAPALLTAGTGVNRADAIVVLGGEVLQRPERAAQLYRAGLAPKIVVSGSGDCGEIVGRLRAAGIKASAIVTDCASTNTAENATYSVALLRRMDARSAIIVTSWFHTRRALGCFVGAGPEMTFAVESAMPRPPRWQLLGGTEGQIADLEFAKTLWYRVVHRKTCHPEAVP